MKIQTPMLMAALLMLQARPSLAIAPVSIPGETVTRMKKGKNLDLMWADPGFDGTKGFQLGKVSDESNGDASVALAYFPAALAGLVKKDSPYILHVAVVMVRLQAHASGRTSAKVEAEGLLVDKGGAVVAAFTAYASKTEGGNERDNAKLAVRAIVSQMSKDLFPSQSPSHAKTPAVMMTAPAGSAVPISAAPVPGGQPTEVPASPLGAPAGSAVPISAAPVPGGQPTEVPASPLGAPAGSAVPISAAPVPGGQPTEVPASPLGAPAGSAVPISAAPVPGGQPTEVPASPLDAPAGSAVPISAAPVPGGQPTEVPASPLGASAAPIPGSTQTLAEAPPATQAAVPSQPKPKIVPPESGVVMPLIPAATAANMKRGSALAKLWISPAYDRASGFSIGEVSYRVETRNDGIDQYLPGALAEIAKKDAPCNLQIHIVEMSSRAQGQAGSYTQLGVEGALVAKDGALIAAFTTRESIVGHGDLVQDFRTAARKVILAISKDLR